MTTDQDDGTLPGKLPKPSGHGWKDRHTDMVRRLIAQVWREATDLQFDLARLGIATDQKEAFAPTLKLAIQAQTDATAWLQSVGLDADRARILRPVVIGIDLSRGRPNRTYPTLPTERRRPPYRKVP